MKHVLRDGVWLTGARARAYCRMLAIAMALATLGMVVHVATEAGEDAHGRPTASDFDAFWAGARLAAKGRAADAYDRKAVTRAENEGARLEGDNYLPYLYPPVFLLLSLPLAALPYMSAMAAFLAAGYAATSASLRKIQPKNWPWLPVLAMPGAMMNAIITQNGFLSASCFAGALLQLERRPLVSGACLGLFAYKPHLAIGIPVALFAARRWRALLACAATASGLATLSWLAFGTITWFAFLHATPVTRAALETHPEIWSKLVSVYGAIRVLHGGAGLGFVAQAIAMAIALPVLARIAAWRPGGGAEIAALVAATMLCTPYVMDYDLVCLGVPMAWIAAEAAATSWRPWEKTVLLACYMLPLFARWLNIHAHLPVTPVFAASLLAVIWGRVAPERTARTARGEPQ